MADIFMDADLRNLLKFKRLVFFGGSNMRALYKDIVWLLLRNSLIPEDQLRRKMEPSFIGDELVKHGVKDASRTYLECRKYSDKEMHIEFLFITRCFSEIIQDYMSRVAEKKIPVPDVVVINSTLWDLTRWGPNYVELFKSSLPKLMKLLKEVLPDTTLVIWLTALPPALKIKRGGLLVNQVGFMENILRFEIMEANMFATSVVQENDFDILDLHYHLRMQIHRRCKDGIHFTSPAVRFMSNLLLTHIALAWGKTLPGRIMTEKLKSYIENKNCEPRKFSPYVPYDPEVDVKPEYHNRGRKWKHSSMGSEVPEAKKRKLNDHNLIDEEEEKDQPKDEFQEVFKRTSSDISNIIQKYASLQIVKKKIKDRLKENILYKKNFQPKVISTPINVKKRKPRKKKKKKKVSTPNDESAGITTKKGSNNKNIRPSTSNAIANVECSASIEKDSSTRKDLPIQTDKNTEKPKWYRRKKGKKASIPNTVADAPADRYYARRQPERSAFCYPARNANRSLTSNTTTAATTMPVNRKVQLQATFAPNNNLQQPGLVTAEILVKECSKIILNVPASAVTQQYQNRPFNYNENRSNPNYHFQNDNRNFRFGQRNDDYVFFQGNSSNQGNSRYEDNMRQNYGFNQGRYEEGHYEEGLRQNYGFNQGSGRYRDTQSQSYGSNWRRNRHRLSQNFGKN